MTPNRYLTQKFAGHPLKAMVKRVYWRLFRRPHSNRLGTDTYLMPGFRCSAPERMTIGQRVLVGRDAHFQVLTGYLDQRFDPKLRIGDDAYIGANCEIVCMSGVSIGAGVTISDHVYINDASHSLDPRNGLFMDRDLVSKGPVILGPGCFIGYGATILSGVTLGEHAVVGARAVVTKPVPPYSMVVGNPARVIARFDLNVGAWIA